MIKTTFKPFNHLTMNHSFILMLAFLMVSGLQKTGFAQNSSEPVKIIFDTDMGPDFDDVGAITILHNLAAKGDCEILATMASDGYPYIAPTLEVFNRYFGKPDIPIGSQDPWGLVRTLTHHRHLASFP